jgi:hypothetical protein
MITITFKKHIIDNEFETSGYDSVKEYILSLIDIEYTQVRFTIIENLGQALDGVFWKVGKDKICNNKVYQIQILK